MTLHQPKVILIGSNYLSCFRIKVTFDSIDESIDLTQLIMRIEYHYL